MLSSIFSRHNQKSSYDNGKKESFNLKQFRANFKRETEVQRDQGRTHVSTNRYPQSKYNDVEKGSSQWIQEKFQGMKRGNRSPEESRRNDSFVSTSQVRIPNFLKESEQDYHSRRYSLQRNIGWAKDSFISKAKDTSTISKYNTSLNYDLINDSKSERFKFNATNSNRKPVSRVTETDNSFQVQQNIEKAKRALNTLNPSIDIKTDTSYTKGDLDRSIRKHVDIKVSDQDPQLIARMQTLKDRLENKFDTPSKLHIDSEPIATHIYKKSTFKDAPTPKASVVTRKFTQLEQKLPENELKSIKSIIEDMAPYEIDQLPSR